VPGQRGYPKALRLTRRREFLLLQREGRRRHTETFVVLRRPAGGPTSRLGITVSSRVGNAVARNRVKRLVREFFRTRRHELRAAIDVVVIARPGAPTLSYAQAANELARALDLEPTPR
jgi:ribonuclease P protein component